VAPLFDSRAVKTEIQGVMPLYEYACKSCGKRFEVRQKFSDEPVKTHEECGGEAERLLSAPAFQFKGSGWYVTDYAKSGGGKSPANGNPDTKSESKSDSKSDSKPDSKSDSKSESKSSDSKSESSASSKSETKSESKSTETKPAGS
jgi:putative FmdB family regulatory protein